MKQLNWNSVIKVKLNSRGKDIYFHRWDELIEKGLKFTPSYPEEDEKGFCVFQLWEFMQIYGRYIGVGYPNITEDINIYIDDDSLVEVNYG